MTRTPYAGGLFVHELVTGERVVMYPNQHIGTHFGTIQFPAGESYGLMFLHCTNVPEFKFSGLSHDAPGSQMEWSQSQGWQRQVYITGRTVYDRNGRLRDTTPAGYQFIGDDGEPVSRLVAYETRNGMNEWTETGGLVIGQGHESGGICVWDGTHLRVLDAGECYFVVVDRSGDQFVISYLKSGEGAIVVRANRSELLSLPILGSILPTPEPTPAPQQEPNPMSLYAPNRQSIVAKYIARYPDLAADEAKRGQIIDFACAEANVLDGGAWGRKSRNPQGTDLNTDGMCFKRPDGLHEIYDAITGSGQSSWDAYGPFKAGENGYWVPARPSQPDVPPVIQPPQPAVDLGPIIERLAQQDARLAALTVRLEALEQKPEPPVFTLPKLRVKGGTSRVFAHAHTVDLEVVAE